MDGLTNFLRYGVPLAFSAQELRYQTTATGVIALKNEKNEKTNGKEKANLLNTVQKSILAVLIFWNIIFMSLGMAK